MMHCFFIFILSYGSLIEKTIGKKIPICGTLQGPEEVIPTLIPPTPTTTAPLPYYILCGSMRLCDQRPIPTTPSKTTSESSSPFTSTSFSTIYPPPPPRYILCGTMRICYKRPVPPPPPHTTTPFPTTSHKHTTLSTAGPSPPPTTTHRPRTSQRPTSLPTTHLTTATYNPTTFSTTIPPPPPTTTHLPTTSQRPTSLSTTHLTTTTYSPTTFSTTIPPSPPTTTHFPKTTTHFPMTTTNFPTTTTHFPTTITHSPTTTTHFDTTTHFPTTTTHFSTSSLHPTALSSTRVPPTTPAPLHILCGTMRICHKGPLPPIPSTPFTTTSVSTSSVTTSYPPTPPTPPPPPPPPPVLFLCGTMRICKNDSVSPLIGSTIVSIPVTEPLPLPTLILCGTMRICKKGPLPPPPPTPSTTTGPSTTTALSTTTSPFTTTGPSTTITPSTTFSPFTTTSISTTTTLPTTSIYTSTVTTLSPPPPPPPPPPVYILCGTMRICDSSPFSDPTTTSTQRTPEAPSDPSVPLVLQPPKDMGPNKYSCSLVRDEHSVCSCVIISENFALSACDKCMRSGEKIHVPDDFTLQYRDYGANSGNNAKMRSTPIRRLMCNTQCYSSFKKYQPKNDIGIVQTYSKLELARKHFAQLPKNIQFTWDYTDYILLSNINYMSTTVANPWLILTKAINGDLCQKLLGSEKFYFDNTCIAYYHEGGGNDCESDTGSSLAVRTNGRETLVGLLTNKVGCGVPRSVGSCVSIKTHLQWIRQTVSRYSGGSQKV